VRIVLCRDARFKASSLPGIGWLSPRLAYVADSSKYFHEQKKHPKRVLISTDPMEQTLLKHHGAVPVYELEQR